jgi:hypothetical protein
LGQVNDFDWKLQSSGHLPEWCGIFPCLCKIGQFILLTFAKKVKGTRLAALEIGQLLLIGEHWGIKSEAANAQLNIQHHQLLLHAQQ